jgi:hypothetical protein
VTDPREARLPKWAQEELRALRYRLTVELQAIEELKGNNPDSDTFLIDYGRKDSPLPRGSRIGYHLEPDDGQVRQQIQVYVESGKLRVQGDYSIVVRPVASNCLTIEMERYR